MLGEEEGPLGAAEGQGDELLGVGDVDADVEGGHLNNNENENNNVNNNNANNNNNNNVNNIGGLLIPLINVGDANNNNVGPFEQVPKRTQKDRQLIEFDHKLYRVEKTLNDRQYLRCVHCNEGTAIRNAYAEGDFGEVEHGHKPCANDCIPSTVRFEQRALTKLAAGAFARDVRVRRATAVTTAKQQYEEKYGPAPLLQNHDPIAPSVLYRARQARYPPVPNTYAQLPVELPEDFCNIRLSANMPLERFLWINNGYPDAQQDLHHQRILGFSTLRNLIQLSKARKIYIDGTFKITPKPFYQVFTFNTLAGPSIERSALIQRMTLLLPSKNTPTYITMFELVLEALELANQTAGRAGAAINWNRISGDFESGVIAAITSENFDPDHIISFDGCWYHYVADVYKFLTTGVVGMAVEYRLPNNPLRPFTHLLYSLPYARPQDIEAAYHDILVHDLPPQYRLDGRMNRFLQYYHSTWVQNDQRRNMVNVHARPDRRTNNDLEGYHQKMNRAISPHLSLWQFIQEMQSIYKETHVFEQNILSNPQGAIPVRPPRMVQRDQRIQDRINMYHLYDSPRLFVHAIRDCLY